MKNLKPKRHQAERENSMGSQDCLLGRDANSLNEKDDGNRLGVLFREMEDWYREEGNRSMAGTV